MPATVAFEYKSTEKNIWNAMHKQSGVVLSISIAHLMALNKMGVNENGTKKKLNKQSSFRRQKKRRQHIYWIRDLNDTFHMTVRIFNTIWFYVYSHASSQRPYMISKRRRNTQIRFLTNGKITINASTCSSVNLLTTVS